MSDGKVICEKALNGECDRICDEEQCPFSVPFVDMGEVCPKCNRPIELWPVEGKEADNAGK